MSGVLELLSAAPFLAEVPEETLRSTASFWVSRQLTDEEVLWSAGLPGSGLAIVSSGELSARVGGFQGGTIGPRELVGEGSAFSARSRRVASIVADGPVDLIVLSGPPVAEVRTEAPALYDALLAEALQTTANRVTRTDDRITELAGGTDPRPERAEGFTQLWRRMTRTFAGEPPPVTRMLRQLPVLQDAPAPALVRIGGHLLARRLAADEALFLEGDSGTSTFLLAEGRIAVFRSTLGEQVERLTDLHAPAMVGTGALLVDRPRNAACVAMEGTWVFEMSQEAHQNLGGETGRLWRETLMVALHRQLAIADSHLAELAATGVDALRRAAVGVVAFEG